MLTWISEQAKWVIYIFIVFILAGLLFMDMSQLQTDKAPPIAKVNDERILNQEFQTRLQQVMQAQAGSNLTDAQTAQLRQDLLEQFIQNHLIGDAMKALQLSGSDAELWEDLMAEPIPGLEKAPAFMTDSVFDQAKYRAWLDTTITGTITDPQLIQYREYLRNQKIPQKQLHLLVTAGFHPSTLEASWSAKHRDTRFQLWTAQASVDSFSAHTPDSAAILAYFNAHPDSFFVSRDLAKVAFVALPIVPSTRDEQSAKEWAGMLINQLKDGADFAEMAKVNSEDLSTAENGGEVTDLTVWGTAFADAVAGLDSGKIVEEPVRTSFGWHVIQSLGKDSTGAPHVRHVLVKITASTETVDSLVALLKSVKDEVEAGKSMQEAAKTANLPVHNTDWFGKGDEVHGVGFIQGLASYAFRNPELPKNDDIASQVLQNKELVALFVRVDSLKAGARSLTPYREHIASELSNQSRMNAAIEYLKGKASELASLTTIDSTNSHAISKLTLESLDNASFEGFVPGLGFASPALYQVLGSQKIGEWGDAVSGNRAAVSVKVISKADPDEATFAADTKNEFASAWNYGAYNMFNDYLKNLQAGAKVVNNLDLYFAE
ncbi:MAG TPA: SurA N-terminal domain-containing protein [Fibrobacteraceae bacterium]|nr:SurA N-terminal domain-containing protein [Fibrobacteraceae bacterium]